MALKFAHDALLCPACDLSNIHHEKIEIYERDEDDAEGLHILVEGLSTTTDTKLDGNPSLRRHGLTIQFRCENCEHHSLLSVSQHKGQTLIEFE